MGVSYATLMGCGLGRAGIGPDLGISSAYTGLEAVVGGVWGLGKEFPCLDTTAPYDLPLPLPFLGLPALWPGLFLLPGFLPRFFGSSS